MESKSQKSQIYQYESIINCSILLINIRNLPHKKMNSLGRQYSFHKLNIKDYLLKIPIPKMDKYDNQIFVILYFPTRSNNDKIPRVNQLLINTIYGMDISLPISQLSTFQFLGQYTY